MALLLPLVLVSSEELLQGTTEQLEMFLMGLTVLGLPTTITIWMMEEYSDCLSVDLVMDSVMVLTTDLAALDMDLDMELAALDSEDKVV